MALGWPTGEVWTRYSLRFYSLFSFFLFTLTIFFDFLFFHHAFLYLFGIFYYYNNYYYYKWWDDEEIMRPGLHFRESFQFPTHSKIFIQESDPPPNTLPQQWIRLILSSDDGDAYCYYATFYSSIITKNLFRIELLLNKYIRQVMYFVRQVQ